MMALKLLSLGRGASGVRWELIALIEGMLATGVTPVVPAQGSVGASGDLAPLAHMAAVMIGEGEAEFDGRVLPGAEALAAAGLVPIALGRQGRARADQRHAVFHCPCAGRPVRGLAGSAEFAAGVTALVDRCDHGLDRAAARRRSMRCAAIAVRSRWRR